MTASTVDFADIAAAIATAFGNTTTPSGLTAIQSSTYLLPENVGVTPCVLVFPYRITELRNVSGHRLTTLDWPVRFFYDMNQDLPNRMADLYQWAQSLANIYPVAASINLGLGSWLRWCQTTTFPAITTFEYGGTVYPVIELTVSTHVGEPLP